MPPLRPLASGLVVLLLAVVLGCSSKNNGASSTASTVPTTGRPAATAGTPGTAATAAPGGRATTTPAAAGSPQAAAAPATPSDCLHFQLTGITPADGTVVPRVVPDPARWTVPDSFLPPGYVNQGHGDLNAESMSVTKLVVGLPDPQTAAQHLLQIGYLGGRQQEWAGPPDRGLTPVIIVQDLAFQSDPGAENFLHDPVITPLACAHDVQGPRIGQDTRRFEFTAPVKLKDGSTSTLGGYTIVWRCGIVDVTVNMVGWPGQFTLQQANDLANNVQSLFLKTDPCS